MTRHYGLPPVARALLPGAAVSLVCIFAACSPDPHSAAAPATPVRVAQATVGPATPAVATNGIVAAKEAESK
jgi:multidrug efflux pump subunit AcrA (membrane-fusion protein)